MKIHKRVQNGTIEPYCARLVILSLDGEFLKGWRSLESLLNVTNLDLVVVGEPSTFESTSTNLPLQLHFFRIQYFGIFRNLSGDRSL